MVENKDAAKNICSKLQKEYMHEEKSTFLW